jgi:hypothetical protein
MAREDAHFRLRIPSELRKWVEEQSARNLRSMTSEIVLAIREKAERMAAGPSPEKANPAVTPNETALAGGSSTHGY